MGEPGVQRVKVYRLNEEGLWDDRGTGHVSVELMEQSHSVGLVVMGESDHTQPLLIHRISADTGYQRQGDDTIITWTDAEIGTDIALSFQEARGCNHIWEQVLHVQESSSPRGGMGPSAADAAYGPRRQGSDPLDDYDHMTGGGPGGRYDEMGPGGGPGEPGSSGGMDLPEPELANLAAISRALGELSLFQRDRIAQQLVARVGYMSKLLELFRMCEDLEDEEGLAALFNIFKQIVLLNDTGLFELLFDDAHVMDFVGALEYEPDVKPEQRPRHREFLRDEAVFKEVVPIASPQLRAKIHQTYRMGYLKNVVLPRVLDDATFATLSSLMLFNNIEVLMELYQDRDFFPELFRRLKLATTDSQEWRDLVAFLQELCGLTKHLQTSQRNALLMRLVHLGLFQVMSTSMASGSPEVKLRATDILLADVQHDPSHLRSYLLQEEEGEGEEQGKGQGQAQRQGEGQGAKKGQAQGQGAMLFGLLIHSLLDGGDSGLQEQVLEMLKMLLDPDTLEGSAEKDKFVELFYDRYISHLLAALVAAGDAAGAPASANGGAAAGPAGAGAAVAAAAAKPAAAGPAAKPGAASGPGQPPPSAATVGLVVDLLCFCVVSHSYRIKYYILRNNVVEKVLKLLRRRERWLVVAAVRFLRTALNMKDEFYNRYLVKNHLLEPVLAAFLENGPRYNLLNSACLELFEFIRKENMKGLLADLMEHHWEQLQAVDYCEVFRNMHIRHEQNQDRIAPGKASERAPEAARAHEAELMARQRSAAAAEQRRRRGEAEVDADEENYFDKEDDSDEEQPSPAGGGRVVLESVSPLPGLLGPLVDYGEDEEDGDTLPLRAAGTPKRTSMGERGGSPPLEKRFKPGSSGGWGATRQGGSGSPPLR